MIFLFPRWDMLIPWRVRDLLSNNFVWNLQLLWVAGLPRNRSGEWFPAASNFHPKNKSKKTKHTHRETHQSMKIRQKTTTSLFIPRNLFYFGWEVSKLRISNPLYCPSTPDPSSWTHDFCITLGLVHVEVGLGNTCRSGSGHWWPCRQGGGWWMMCYRQAVRVDGYGLL